MDTAEGENVTKGSGYHVPSSLRPTRERIGLIVNGTNAAAAGKTIVAAESAGVRQIWMGQPHFWPDALTTLAAAFLVRTYASKIFPAIVRYAIKRILNLR
jgi:hypothetical protein